jgi:hypothetical protein
MECRIVDGAPVGIYSVTGTLLREYHDFCETEVPASDRTVILHQVMIQSRESDVPFSKKDLVFAAEYQLTEARLIGRSFILSLKPGRAGWPEPGILARRCDECTNNPELFRMLERIGNSPTLEKYSWDPEIDLLQARNDTVCKKIAEHFDLDYRQTPLAGCYLPPGNRRAHFR